MTKQPQPDFKKGKLVHLTLLVLSIGIIVLANAYFKDQLELVGNAMYIPVNVALVATSVYFLVEFRKKINTLALLSIVGLAISWLIAEIIWSIYEMVFKVSPFPSPADVFYILGYPLLLIFLYVVGKTTKAPNQIKIVSGAVGLIFMIPTIVAAATIYGSDPFEFLLAGTYTIFDAVLIWITLNNVLTVHNRQNQFWVLMFIGLALLLIADSFFIVLSISNQYYTGHPIEVMFYCSYIAISYGLYYQAKMSKNRPTETIEELFSPKKFITTNFVQNLILISSSVVIIIAVSLIVVLGFDEFTTNQVSVFSTIMGISVSIVAILSLLTFVLGKKIDGLRKLERKYEENRPTEQIQPAYSVPTLLTRIDRLERSNKRIGVITLTSFLLTTVLVGAYISENFFDLIPAHDELQSGRYVLETQKGIQIEKTTIWKIASDKQLQIDIVHSDLVSQDKISAIKNAILSEETIEIPNSELGKVPEDGTGTYYLGWAGALKKAAESQTEINIPTNLRVDTSNKPDGDVIIVLSNLKESDGTLGFTKSIADDQQSQILKSTITIFDATNLNTHELTAITRHEFGHAIGLGHSTASEDLMYPKFNSKYPYISSCDVDSLASLYDKRGSPAVVCED